MIHYYTLSNLFLSLFRLYVLGKLSNAPRTCLSLLFTQESPTNVTLTIVREQEASGEVAVHYQTGSALSKPPSNQASAPQDYTPREGTVIMKENATLALITITILPVRIEYSRIE